MNTDLSPNQKLEGSPAKPPIHSAVKWIIIGFLGTLAMLLIFAGVMIIKFTPLLHINSLKDKIFLLGRLIEVDGKDERLWKSDYSDEEWHNTFEGSFPLTSDQSISIKFGNGNFKFLNSHETTLNWNCNVPNSQTRNISPVTQKSEVQLDFSFLSKVNCEIIVPQGRKLSINGANGKIKVNEPHFHANIQLTNGIVEIHPDAHQLYRYSLSVTNGRVDPFESSNKTEALFISVHVINGLINHEE